MLVPDLKSSQHKGTKAGKEKPDTTRDEHWLATGHLALNIKFQKLKDIFQRIQHAMYSCNLTQYKVLEIEGYFSKNSACNVFLQLDTNGQLASCGLQSKLQPIIMAKGYPPACSGHRSVEDQGVNCIAV